MPVSRELDLRALAAVMGGKRAVMAEPEVAARATGYVIGGISPVGQRRRHRTVLDASALHWSTVYISGGKRGLEIELAPADLVHATQADTASIGR